MKGSFSEPLVIKRGQVSVVKWEITVGKTVSFAAVAGRGGGHSMMSQKTAVKGTPVCQQTEFKISCDLIEVCSILIDITKLYPQSRAAVCL